MQKLEISAYTVLFTGVALLVFTFINAYIFLIEELNILGSSDMLKAFGEALGPLIVASIRVMFLAVMGWIGSIITIRGVQLLTQLGRETKQEAKTETRTTIKPGTEEAKRIEDALKKESKQPEGTKTE